MHAPVPHSLGTDCGCDSLNCEKGLGGGGHYAHGSYKHGYALPSYVQEEPRALDGYGTGSFGAVEIDCDDVHGMIKKAIEDAAAELGLDETTMIGVKLAVQMLSKTVTTKLWGYAREGLTSFKAKALGALPASISGAVGVLADTLLSKTFDKLGKAVEACGTVQAAEPAPTTPALNYSGSITGIKTAGGYVTAPKVYPSATMYPSQSQLDPQASLLQQAAAAGKLSMFARPDLYAASQKQVTPQLQLPPAQKSSMLPLIAVGAVAALLLLR
jgi:hypothetical protein